MQKLDLQPSRAGFNVRGEFTINQKNAMLDIFIRRETSIEEISDKIHQALQSQSYILLDDSEKDIEKYAKIIFHNMRNFGMVKHRESKDELSKPKTIIDEIVEMLSEDDFIETIYPIRSEVKLSVGRREDVQKFLNVITLLLTRMDVEAIESIAYVDTEIVVSARTSFNPRDPEDLRIITSMNLQQLVRKYLYEELKESIIKAAEMANKLMKNQEALAILNQIFERRYGFSALKDVKRIKDAKFNELMEQLSEHMEMMNG